MRMSQPLTIEDLRNLTKKSGFDNVRFHGDVNRTKRYQASWGTKKGAGTTHSLAWRLTAEEAAQDYCDYVNGQKKILTIEDLRNPKRKSGFDRVAAPRNDRRPGRTNPKPYQAQQRIASGDVAGSVWVGPRRSKPEEAAQDYCDYINGQNNPNVPTKLNYPGHAVRDTQEKTAEEIEALGVLRDIKAQKEGRQGYVYCIAEGDTKNPYAVKVGYSVKPEARVGELQSGNCRVLSLLGYKEGTLQDEKALHGKYIAQNLVGEWFTPTPELLQEFKIK